MKTQYVIQKEPRGILAAIRDRDGECIRIAKYFYLETLGL